MPLSINQIGPQREETSIPAHQFGALDPLAVPGMLTLAPEPAMSSLLRGVAASCFLALASFASSESSASAQRAC